jgi:hypothetical protein
MQRIPKWSATEQQARRGKNHNNYIKCQDYNHKGYHWAFSPSFIEAKWLLIDCLCIRLCMVGALAALATSREEQDVRQLFEKFGHVTSFLTKRDVEEQPNQLLDHARGKAGQRRVGQVAFQQRHDVEDFL